MSGDDRIELNSILVSALVSLGRIGQSDFLPNMLTSYRVVF